MIVDLGYGTTHMWGSGEGTSAAIWYVDGKRVALSSRQLHVLALALQHGTDEAAIRLGIATPTAKHLLTRLYKRLGVFGKSEAAIALGWTRIPAELLDASPEADMASGGRSVAGPSLPCPARSVPAHGGARERTPPRGIEEDPGGSKPEGVGARGWVHG